MHNSDVEQPLILLTLPRKTHSATALNSNSQPHNHYKQSPTLDLTLSEMICIFVEVKKNPRAMRFIYSLLLACITFAAAAQPTSKRYGAEPLHSKSRREWQKIDRPAIMRFFQEEIYGIQPPNQPTVEFRVVSEGVSHSDRVIRREVEMCIGGTTKAQILIYLPRDHRGRVPAFLV